MTSKPIHVLIVGAGASGIYAAHLLEQQGIEVTILEASWRWGGRIRPLHEFAGFPVELGAEEIIGTNTEWYRLVRASGKPLVTTKKENYYLLDGKPVSEKHAQHDPDIQRAWEFEQNIKNYRAEDMTLEQFVISQGIPDRVRHIVNANIASEWGSSEARIGMRGLAEAEHRYNTTGQGSFLRQDSLLSVFETLFPKMIQKIRLNTEVKTVDYRESCMKVTDATGKVFEADRVIVTVPVTLLKAGAIEFLPALPDEKQHALSHIGMDNIMKLILKFRRRFWAKNTAFIYSRGFVSVFWSPGTGRSSSDHILTGFVSGSDADHFSPMGDNSVSIALQELDNMYGKGVATNSLDDFYVMDWQKEPFIRGGYSYQLLGSENCRDLLAKPVTDRLFFAGEAASITGNFGSVQGAIETAVAAVEQVKKSLSAT